MGQLRQAHPGEARFAGTGEELRDWLDVQDAAALLLTAARQASAACPIVNGGTGQAASVRTIVEGLERELGVAIPPVFSGERRSGDPIGYEADIAGALAWGWRPERSLADGLAAYAAWFLDEAR